MVAVFCGKEPIIRFGSTQRPVGRKRCRDTTKSSATWPDPSAGIFRWKCRRERSGGRRTEDGAYGPSQTHGLESPCQCVHETMNSECESHYLRGDRDCGAVEGNCVAARRGGEQPETEGRSRTKVNSIRHVRRASLLARGEACRVSGKPVTALMLSKLATGRLGCGWSENDPKRAWDKWRSRRGELSRDGVRGFIVAMKPANAGGAKGPRKVNAR